MLTDNLTNIKGARSERIAGTETQDVLLTLHDERFVEYTHGPMMGDVKVVADAQRQFESALNLFFDLQVLYIPINGEHTAGVALL